MNAFARPESCSHSPKMCFYFHSATTAACFDYTKKSDEAFKFNISFKVEDKTLNEISSNLLSEDIDKKKNNIFTKEL